MNLQVIDTETGEIPASCETCEALKQQLVGAERELRAWRTRYANLESKLSPANYSDDPLWREAEVLFDFWRTKCKHPRSKFSADRFLLVRPYLERYGLELCRRAVEGAAFDPYTQTRKNGSTKRFDSLDLIFRSSEKVEDFANRAPRPRSTEQTLEADSREQEERY